MSRKRRRDDPPDKIIEQLWDRVERLLFVRRRYTSGSRTLMRAAMTSDRGASIQNTFALRLAEALMQLVSDADAEVSIKAMTVTSLNATNGVVRTLIVKAYW